MLRKDLAEALGLSAASITKQAKRGMPTHDVEAARRWRERHLEIARRKSPPPAAQTQAPSDTPRPQPAAAHDAGQALEHARQIIDLAAELLAAGRLQPMLGAVRAALRAVPAHARHELLLPMPLWDSLVNDVTDAIEAATDEDETCPEMTDDEAAVMGDFWMAVACGEVEASALASLGLTDGP